jgi:hypothetical protein
MIESDQADLEGTFDICVCDWDGVMKFPGYSVSKIPSVDNLVRLVRVQTANCHT